METETRRVWSLPGIKIPFASIGRGKDHWGVGYWRYELFVSAWVAQITWWHYEFTGDRKVLEQFGWPLIRGVAEFYLAYLEPDPATGKLCLPLTKLCEDTMFNVVPVATSGARRRNRFGGGARAFARRGVRGRGAGLAG